MPAPACRFSTATCPPTSRPKSAATLSASCKNRPWTVHSRSSSEMAASWRAAACRDAATAVPVSAGAWYSARCTGMDWAGNWRWHACARPKRILDQAHHAQHQPAHPGLLCWPGLPGDADRFQWPRRRDRCRGDGRRSSPPHRPGSRRRGSTSPHSPQKPTRRLICPPTSRRPSPCWPCTNIDSWLLRPRPTATPT